MGNSIRWSQDDLASFLKKAEKRGAVTTHVCADDDVAAMAKAKKARDRGKYGNVKAEADGMVFASKRERGRWMDLRLEEKSGAIKNLQRQVAYPLCVNGIEICRYLADFVYERDGAVVVEDSKGYRTDVFKIKAKLMQAVHGIEILET